MGLFARLYYLQVIQYVDLTVRAQRQHCRLIEVTPKRGTIYDRQMQPLAISLTVDSVYAMPAEIPDPELVAKSAAPILGLDATELEGRLRASRTFCWVKRKVSEEQAERLRALNLKGIYFQQEAKRFYPHHELAAHVLGYVGIDGDGLAGQEYALNEQVRGKAGKALVAADARRQSFRSQGWEGQPGKNVVLTLDRTIQYIVEKELRAAVQKWQAAGGTVIVQNPGTGEVLAMANEPTFDPNRFQESTFEAHLNRAVGWVYEPGSTFKLVALAAALEEQLTTPNEVINCQHGSIVLAGHVIHDHEPYDNLTVEQVLAQSSGVGIIKLALRLGEERFYRYITNFGFGARTGIDAPGEERGLIKPPARWSGISIGEISMGQEVGVTPLQVVSAYSAIANGGVLFQPRLVRDVFLGDAHEPIPPAVGHRVVSERTAATMRQLLSAVVESGTGRGAQLDGYTAAGKTGTAQKIDSSGSYSKTHYAASFVGFAPVSRPAVTILVVIDSPVGAIYGAEVAAPVFRSIAEQTLAYLNIPHDNPSRWPSVQKSLPAGALGQKRERQAGLLPFGPEPAGVATSPVRPASFSSFESVTNPGIIPVEDHAAIGLESSPLVIVPDLTGLAVRQVTRECQRLGLELNLNGSGLAVEQNPTAGSQIPAGSHIWVRFAR
jgi:cell division protein FtsI (penicillin-binding protein 3)